jgi:hypothetical protein
MESFFIDLVFEKKGKDSWEYFAIMLISDSVKVSVITNSDLYNFIDNQPVTSESALIHKMLSLSPIPHSCDILSSWGKNLDFPKLNDLKAVNKIVFGTLLAILVKNDHIADAIALCRRYLKTNTKNGVKTWLFILKRTIESMAYPWPQEFDEISTSNAIISEWFSQNDRDVETTLLIYMVRKYKSKEIIQDIVEFLVSVCLE